MAHPTRWLGTSTRADLEGPSLRRISHKANGRAARVHAVIVPRYAKLCAHCCMPTPKQLCCHTTHLRPLIRIYALAGIYDRSVVHYAPWVMIRQLIKVSYGRGVDEFGLTLCHVGTEVAAWTSLTMSLFCPDGFPTNIFSSRHRALLFPLAPLYTKCLRTGALNQTSSPSCSYPPASPDSLVAELETGAVALAFDGSSPSLNRSPVRRPVFLMSSNTMSAAEGLPKPSIDHTSGTITLTDHAAAERQQPAAPEKAAPPRDVKGWRWGLAGS